jgi:hypothetical protein
VTEFINLLKAGGIDAVAGVLLWFLITKVTNYLEKSAENDEKMLTILTDIADAVDVRVKKRYD